MTRATYPWPVLRADGPIHTARLTLRPFGPGDLDDLYDYQSRPDVARYLHWEARDRAQVREALEQQCREVVLDKEGDWLTYAVALPETGKVIGEVGLKWLSAEHRQGEIGFVFNPDYQGRGLATEAAEAMLGVGFDDLSLHRIIASCMAQNTSSARLMERLGMRREAHLIHSEIIKGRWADELVYAILDYERRALAAAPRSR
jgi:RimJ/RimL family protein N-acetyltransferase